MSAPAVSVVVAMHNARASIDRTLDSLIAQTFTHWEAVVVDDGSTDSGARRVGRRAAVDGRVRLLRRANGGASAARNTGLAAAQAPLALFLDADDWIAPDHLATLVPMLAGTGGGALSYCAYIRVTPDGEALPPDWCPRLMTDPFGLLARQCEPAIHCVVVPVAAVAAVGGFDEGLATCEDWDLWQRLARSGIRFLGTDRPLAFYEMRDGSLSTRWETVERDAGVVLARGASVDPRVADPHLEHALGSAEASAVLALTGGLEAAGAALVRDGTEPSARLLADVPEDALDLRDAAAALVRGALEWSGTPAQRAADILPPLLGAVGALCADLPPSRCEMDAAQLTIALAERALGLDALDRPVTTGGWHARTAELTALEPLVPPLGAERLALAVTLRGEPLGRVVLPVFGSVSTGDQVASALAQLPVKAMARRVVPGWSAAGAVTRTLTKAVRSWGNGARPTATGLARRLAAASVASRLTDRGRSGAAALRAEFAPTPLIAEPPRKHDGPTDWRVPVLAATLGDPTHQPGAWTVAALAEPLGFLARRATRTVTLDTLWRALATHHPLPTGSLVLLIAGAGRTDIAALDALLERHGFTAVLSLPDGWSGPAPPRFDLALTPDERPPLLPPVERVRGLSAARARLTARAGRPTAADLSEWPVDPVLPNCLAVAGFDLVFGPAPGFVDLERADPMLRRIELEVGDGLGMLAEKLRRDRPRRG